MMKIYNLQAPSRESNLNSQKSTRHLINFPTLHVRSSCATSPTMSLMYDPLPLIQNSFNMIQTSQSLDVKRAEDLSSEELLNPLGSLYPHVVALQLQSDDTPWIRAKNYAGYQDRNNNSWVDVYSTEDYARPSARRRSGA